MIMTTEDLVLLIKKMGIKVSVDYNPSEEKVQRIKERLKTKERYEKRIQEMSRGRLQLYAETSN